MAGAPGPIANSNEPTESSNGVVGASPSDWRSALPDDLRTEPTLASFKDVSTLAKSFVDTKRMVGDSIRLPKSDASPEEWAKLYDKLGRPAAPDKYELAPPDGVAVDEGLQSWARSAFHQAGLSPAQAKIIYDGYLEQYSALQSKQDQTGEQALESAKTTLTQEWGHAYDTKIALATDAAKHLGGQELLDELQRTGAGASPIVVKALAKYGTALKEGGLVRGQVSMEDDQASAQEEINAILSQADTHPMSPMNKKLYGKAMDAAIENWRKLHERAAGPRGQETP